METSSYVFLTATCCTESFSHLAALWKCRAATKRPNKPILISVISRHLSAVRLSLAPCYWLLPPVRQWNTSDRLNAGNTLPGSVGWKSALMIRPFLMPVNNLFDFDYLPNKKLCLFLNSFTYVPASSLLINRLRLWTMSFRNTAGDSTWERCFPSRQNIIFQPKLLYQFVCAVADNTSVHWDLDKALDTSRLLLF